MARAELSPLSWLIPVWWHATYASPGESMRAVSRIVCEDDKIARKRAALRPAHGRARFTEATFSSERLLVAN